VSGWQVKRTRQQWNRNPRTYRFPAYSVKWNFCECSGSQHQGPPNTVVNSSGCNQWM